MRQTAFTLIELLVVIAIISLLVSILLPSLQRVRQQAQALKCSTNLHAIGRAGHIYATEYDGYVMRDCSINQGPDMAGHELWAAKYAPYLGGPEIEPPEDHFDEQVVEELLDSLEVFRCPAVDRPEYSLHYVINARNFDWIYHDRASDPTNRHDYQGATRVSSLPKGGTEMMYIMEGNFDILEPGRNWHKYDCFSKGHVPFSPEGWVLPYPRMIHSDDQRHFGSTTLVFFDGHAEKRSLSPQDIPFSLLDPLLGRYK